MRVRLLLASVMVVTVVGSAGFLAGRVGRPAGSSHPTSAAAPLIVVQGEEPLRSIRPAACETVIDSRGIRSVRVRGDILTNDGPDARIVVAEFRVLAGSRTWHERREWRVLVGESMSNITLAGNRSDPIPPRVDRCLLFIESTATYVPVATGPPPFGAGAQIGVAYEYSLTTHCGLTRLEFDGRWWNVSPPVASDPHNQPPGWDDPAIGTIILIARNQAEFRSKGRIAHLVPGPTPSALGECN